MEAVFKITNMGSLKFIFCNLKNKGIQELFWREFYFLIHIAVNKLKLIKLLTLLQLPSHILLPGKMKMNLSVCVCDIIYFFAVIVQLISDAGYQGEITSVSTACQQLEVFSRVLRTSLATLLDGGEENLEKNLPEFAVSIPQLLPLSY